MPLFFLHIACHILLYNETMKFEIRDKRELIRAIAVTVTLSILLSNILVYFFETTFSPPIALSDFIGTTFISGIASTIASTLIFSQTYQLSQTKTKLENLNERLLFMQKKLRKQAETDSLTGLANRRSFFSSLQKEISRHQRHQHPLSMLLIDIDHFKKVNDSFGHIAGDHVLQELAITLEDSVREHDLVARTGGEEFCALLPETKRDEAADMAERIRQSVKSVHMECKICNAPMIKITVSIGVAEIASGEDVDKFYNRVDMALYCAKNAGRNCVKVA